MNKKLIILLGFTITFIPALSQEFTCESAGGQWLNQIIGNWEVTTRDRTSPGNYEENTGLSDFSPTIEGCGIRESFRGKFKGNNYAREVSIFAIDSFKIAMTALDSEHGSFSNFEGSISENTMTALWYRDKEKKRLQSKYILTVKSEGSFEFSSFLSTDYGETWALTHERKYQRRANAISDVISNYHKGFAESNATLIRNSISNQLNMINGNFSDDPAKWQAHQFLMGNEIDSWLNMMLTNAGPFRNKVQIKNQNMHNNSAVVVTVETGENKFRKWENEEVTYYLANINGSWQMTGFFIKNLKNRE